MSVEIEKKSKEKKMYSINVRFGLVRFVPGLNLVRIPVGPERKVTKIERYKIKKKKHFSAKKKKGGT